MREAFTSALGTSRRGQRSMQEDRGRADARTWKYTPADTGNPSDLGSLAATHMREHVPGERAAVPRKGDRRFFYAAAHAANATPPVNPTVGATAPATRTPLPRFSRAPWGG
eukprot:11764306-Alexandrium_andersonii.AAC.1